jgi:hypothetical protein
MLKPSREPRKRPSLEVVDIFHLHGEEYKNHYPVSPEQRKAMADIIRCRTAGLGGHVDTCDQDCGFTRISYNSCRNRHCPKCQSLNQAKWLEARKERLLPTQYFHTVITFPHELNPLILQNKEVLYNLLFQTASQALQKLALQYPRLQAQLGFTAVLHTWDQDLQFHPHLHLVVTGGGLDPSANRWVPAKNSFLLPVKALSQIVRGKFLDALRETFHEGKLSFRGNTESLKEESTFDRFLKKLRRQKWVAYSKTSPELISKLAQNAKREFSSAGPSFLPSQRKLFWIPHEPSPDPKKPKLSKPLTKASRKVMSKIPNLECGSLPPIQKPYAPNPFQSETLPLTPPNISPTPPP